MIEIEFEKKIDLIFEEFLASFYQSFLFETKNRDLVFQYFEKRVKERQGSEKDFFINLKVFDIGKVRELIEYGNINFSENRFFVISFYSITHQAQNALLKFLEDTGENVKVVLIVHSGANLIDTLISRSYKLEIPNEQILSESGEEEFLTASAEKFLATKPLYRMKLKEIEEILKRRDEYALEFEDRERADREILERFLLNLHKILSEKLENSILEFSFRENKETKTEEVKGSLMFDYQNKEFLSQIEDVMEAIKYAKNNSSSGKTLLEYLSLKLPVISK